MGVDEKPVIIIGAGISGLSAAKYLTEQRIPVIVLEANDRVGGRTYTNWDKTKYGWVDWGGSWVGPTQNHLLRTLRDLGIEAYPTFDDLNYIHYSKGKRCVYNSRWPPFWWSNPFSGFDIRYVTRLMDKMMEEIPADRPWDCPKAKEWDSKTMAEFIRENCWTRHAAEFIEMFVNVGVTSLSEQVSLLWFLWYVKQCGGTWRFISSDNGGQELKLVGGTGEISLKMVERVGSDKVLLSKPVTHIEQQNHGVVVFTKDGSRFEGSYIIQAAPLPMHLRMTYDPPLPPLRRQLIQRASMGMAIKVIMWFKNAYWIKEGLNGMVSCADGIEFITLSIVDLSEKISNPSITCFVTAERAACAVKMDPETRKQAIISSLLRMHGCKNAEKPIQYTEYIWMEEPYIGGCYTSTYPPGVMSVCGHTIREPFQRMYFAGTETATEWSGYMNGAVQAGERAAKEILCTMGKLSRSQVWAKEPPNDMCLPRPFQMSFLERHPPSIPQVLFFYGIVLPGLLGAAAYYAWKKYCK